MQCAQLRETLGKDLPRRSRRWHNSLMKHEISPYLQGFAALICLGSALPAQAESRIVSVLSGDWNANQSADAAILFLRDEGMADLVLYEGNEMTGLEPVLRLDGVIWAGPMAGQTPRLEARSATSFAIRSTQTAIGRTPWDQHITVAWRDGMWKVAGYDYTFHDRIDLDHYGTCSVNLLTGRYTLTYGPGEGRAEVIEAGTSSSRAIALSALTEDFVPPVCSRLFD